MGEGGGLHKLYRLLREGVYWGGVKVGNYLVAEGIVLNWIIELMLQLCAGGIAILIMDANHIIRKKETQEHRCNKISYGVV